MGAMLLALIVLAVRTIIKALLVSLRSPKSEFGRTFYVTVFVYVFGSAAIATTFMHAFGAAEGPYGEDPSSLIVGAILVAAFVLGIVIETIALLATRCSRLGPLLKANLIDVAFLCFFMALLS